MLPSDIQLLNLDYSSIRDYFDRTKTYAQLTERQQGYLETLRYVDDDFTVDSGNFGFEHNAVNGLNVKEQLVGRLMDDGYLTTGMLQQLEQIEIPFGEGAPEWNYGFLDPIVDPKRGQYPGDPALDPVEPGVKEIELQEWLAEAENVIGQGGLSSAELDQIGEMLEHFKPQQPLAAEPWYGSSIDNTAQMIFDRWVEEGGPDHLSASDQILKDLGGDPSKTSLVNFVGEDIYELEYKDVIDKITDLWEDQVESGGHEELFDEHAAEPRGGGEVEMTKLDSDDVIRRKLATDEQIAEFGDTKQIPDTIGKPKPLTDAQIAAFRDTKQIPSELLDDTNLRLLAQADNWVADASGNMWNTVKNITKKIGKTALQGTILAPLFLALPYIAPGKDELINFVGGTLAGLIGDNPFGAIVQVGISGITEFNLQAERSKKNQTSDKYYGEHFGWVRAPDNDGKIKWWPAFTGPREEWAGGLGERGNTVQMFFQRSYRYIVPL